MYQDISANSIELTYKRIKDRINRTPVFTSLTLNKELDSDIYLKCENFQKVGAFKFRGAINAVSLLSDEEKKNGIIAHSSGNHAQAVALAGKIMNIETVIVMPKNSPSVKVNATNGYGAKVVFSENSIESRVQVCNDLIKENNYCLIHPYDNKNVINGAGTASLELIQEIGNLDYIIAPVGGGGLISGTSIYCKDSGKCKVVIGAEPERANDAYRGIKSGNRVTHHTPSTIADGLRTILSEMTFTIVKDHVDEIITVSEQEIIDSMRFIWERMKLIIEPSSSTVLAALRKGIKSGQIDKNKKIGLIISGGNVDLSSFFNNLINQAII